MSRPSLRNAALFAVFSMWLASTEARAQRLDPQDVPEPLKPWTHWVLHNQRHALCPSLPGATSEGAPRTECAWPARLSLSLDDRGGKFEQRWRLHERGFVALPGSAQRWPQEVTVNGARAVVVERDGGPAVQLDKGDHRVEGSFLWDSLPESVQIPHSTGLLSLTVRGAPVRYPNRDAGGQVWLQKTAAPDEGERLELIVHRKLSDDIPARLVTQLQLEVSGKSREVLLGKALPPRFIPMSLTSPLPARLEPDSRLRIQVRPGTWTVELDARSEGPVSELGRPQPEGPWRDGEEVWVFEARPELRQVVVEGVSAIDPQQTTLPDAWKKLPAYPMPLGAKLQLSEKRRGDSDPAPDQLQLARTLWLDFDGKGFTANDRMTGSLSRSWRLEMAAPTTLGRVAVGGRDQFITRLDDPNRRGVEIRQGKVDVSADSRIEDAGGTIPAVGWSHDFHQVSATLNLPPGWLLLHAAGVDDADRTWLKHWSLFELFLALVTALVVGRLYGWGWGALALGTFILVFPEVDAPSWSWLMVLAGEALVRVVPGGELKKWLERYRLAALVILAIVSVSFLAAHLRQGLYPALGQPFSGGGGLTLGAAMAPPMAQSEVAAASPGADMPAAEPPSPMEDDRSGEGEWAKSLEQQGSLRSGLISRRSAPKKGYGYDAENIQVHDPNAMVQTGPGLPNWSWRSIQLRWSGPVESSQQLRLFLLSPGTNRLLAFVRAALIALLFLRLAAAAKGSWHRLKPPSAPTTPSAPSASIAGALLAFALPLTLSLVPAPARASEAPEPAVPKQEVLDELRKRLLAPPECSPRCASSARLVLEVQPKTLRGRLEVSAAAHTAAPLPGNNGGWIPEQVLLDGEPARGLFRTPDGTLWVELSPGSHQVQLEGPMPPRDTVPLALPLKPHRVEIRGEGWEVDGLHEDGLADDNLQFRRLAKDASDSTALQPGALPPFVRVERTLRLGLTWRAETRVIRLTPAEAAAVLEVPLLTGESVTSAEVRVAAGKAQVNLAPGVSELSWSSVLEPREKLALKAPLELPWTEVWRLDVGPIWHASYKGIPVVHQHTPAGDRLPEWRPWAGEEVLIDVTRPAGIAGQTLTIDSSQLQLRPGLRSTDATLTLRLRSSRGAQHVLTLPEGAQLESVSLNGAVQPIRQEGRKVTLPLVPGAQVAQLSWRQPEGLSFSTTLPEVDVGAPTVNAEVTVEPPSSRWVLFVSGPTLGPAVLFWSYLLVILLAAFGLARVRFAPLKVWEWLLLGIGLSQVPVEAAALVAGWLLALGWRARHNPAEGSVVGFNLRQLALAFWTLVALSVLVSAIHQGLLGSPDMQISGNGSSRATLRWLQDRTGSVLPTPWILSVPMLLYRVAMLGWALWLAFAVLRWLKWGWGAFVTGGAWRRSPPRQPTPP